MDTNTEVMDNSKIINKVKVRPTHLAQVCPVCNGFTTVKHGSLPCGACKDETGISRGYVLIPAEEI